MSRPAIRRVLTALALALLIAPTAYGVFPTRAHADQPVIVTADVSHTSLLDLIKNTATSIFSGTTAANTTADKLKEYVLDPLVKALAHALLQELTASIINWINTGNAGAPIFNQNLGQYLLATADIGAMQFFNEITGISNSPFANAIATSLEVNYLQSTSASGFWAANQCTLAQVSNDITGYVAGKFLQGGGWNAWFALTTQPQNNPYTLYYRAQAELNSRINSALGQGLTKLGWGSGFFSWCSASGSSDGSGLEPVTVTPRKSDDATTPATSATKGVAKSGDPCTDSNGNAGTVQTPGTVIAGSINKALGAPQDELVSAKELDDDVNAVFAALVTKVLSVGLSAISGQDAITDPLRTTTGAGTTVGSDITSQIQSSLASYESQLSNYQTSWTTLVNAANTASSSVQAVIACENHSGGGDPYGAQSALTNEIGPVLAQGMAAASTTALGSAEVAQAQQDLSNASTTAALSTVSNEAEALLTAPPTSADVQNVEQDAMTLGGATASSSDSLQVSGGSTLDQMQLINTNAGNALNACQTPLGAPFL